MELIERHIISKKQPFNQSETQFAINNYGHLTVRKYDKGDRNKDTLIVFTEKETNDLRNFLKRTLSNW